MGRRRKVVVRGLVVLGVLTAVLVGVVGWRASGILRVLVGNWAVAAVSNQSGGVYRLDVGRVRLNWLLRRATVDSVRVTTNPGANAKTAKPLPELQVAFDRCRLSGVHLVRLVLGRGFYAHSFGCGKGSVALSAVSRPAGAARPPITAAAVPRPPANVPGVRIARVDFPDVALEVRLPRASGGETRIALERVRWHLEDFAIDPADSAAADRPLFSRVVELAADSLVVRPDSFTALRIRHFRASLSDSTLDAEGLGFAPSVPLGAFKRRGTYPPDVILVHGARVRMQGLDLAALVLGSGVNARRVTVDSLHVKVTTDYRGPVHHSTHRTPQQWIEGLGQTVDVDSIVVHEGEVEYREMRPDQAAPGVLTFGHIEATAAPVHHFVGRQSTGDSLTFVATAQLLHAGRLAVRITMPLDAPTFDMAFGGTLGPMPATAFNLVLEHLESWKIEDGQVQRITFGATVHRGVARGSLTPIYTDLSVRVTGHGAGGILSAHGILGGAARGLASLVANMTTMKQANPHHAGETPRSGPISHTFAPNETFPKFLWVSLREALLVPISR